MATYQFGVLAMRLTAAARHVEPFDYNAWPYCGFPADEPPPEWSSTNAGFWRDEIRTVETVGDDAEVFRVSAENSWDAGYLDGVAWAAAHPVEDLPAEISAMLAGDFGNSGRTMFLIGRYTALNVENGTAYVKSTMSGVKDMAMQLGFVDRMFFGNPYPIFLPPVDEYAVQYNLVYRASREGSAAASYDLANSNPEGTSIVFDESLKVTIFDSYDYDTYAENYMTGYGYTFHGVGP